MSLRNTTVVALCSVLTANFVHCRMDGKEWKRLIDAGINDWGGVSPVTKDWVNPEVSFQAVFKFQQTECA